MEQINLRNYFDKMGYGKYTSSVNVSTFAKRCGVSVATVSRILKGTYSVKKPSEAFDKIKKVVEEDGYELVMETFDDQLKFIEEYITSLETECAQMRKLLEENGLL